MTIFGYLNCKIAHKNAIQVTKMGHFKPCFFLLHACK